MQRTFTELLSGQTIAGRLFAEDAKDAAKEKGKYAASLEGASGDEVFKYLLLINVSALDGYIAQARLQAEQSFRLTRWIAALGSLLIGGGVALGIVLNTIGKPTLEAAYLAAIAGVLTEFISGVFFYLYNRTLQQINRFHDRLVYMQQLSMSYLAASLVADAAKRDDARIDISRSSLVVPHGVPELSPSDGATDTPKTTHPKKSQTRKRD
jgi:Cyanobacterial TRADD-N associated 2-Transmembrane domain